MKHIKTYEPSNQFKVKCPIFNAETRISACIELRDRYWRGEKVPVRRGCQVAMQAGKCPIPNIISRITRDGSDPYYSAEPRLGSFSEKDLQSVSRVLVMERSIDEFGCSPQEAAALKRGNAETCAGTWMQRRGGAAVKMDEIEARRPAPVARRVEQPIPTPIVDSEIVSAATSGNLAAAIS